MYKGVMYIFGGFDGMKRNDIYRILFDEEEKKRNLQDYEMRQMARSFSLINSSMDEQAPLAMELIRGARRAGVDVTTESYPYTAGSTRLESALFDNWQGDYGQLQWTVTGERLTRETFEEYRKTGGWVIIHGRNEVTNHWLISQPDIMVASDGVPFVGNASHPRGAGTFARVLGHYVRDEGALDLISEIILS